MTLTSSSPLFLALDFSDHRVQIVNESLPIFLDKVLGGGISAVIASTVLIGEFAPSRHPVPSRGGGSSSD